MNYNDKVVYQRDEIKASIDINLRGKVVIMH